MTLTARSHPRSKSDSASWLCSPRAASSNEQADNGAQRARPTLRALRLAGLGVLLAHAPGYAAPADSWREVARMPADNHDLAAADPARLSAMIAFLRETLDATSAQLPTVRATSMPVERP